MKRAFVTGVGGQDGYYLSRLLLGRGYQVGGCDRPGALGGAAGDELRGLGVSLVELDLLDGGAVRRAVDGLRPDEIYNLAGESFVPQSWEDPGASIRANVWPLIHLLEAVRGLGLPARLFQASTAEIFGLARTSPQDEETPLAPANPYAAAKALAHQLTGLYRLHHQLFACAGILYNHESPRRPARFVTAKVCQAARAIRAGRQRELALGDLDVTRDWGFAGDHVEAMWLMLQQSEPVDCVVGTGLPHTVRDLCRVAFEAVGLDYREFVRSDPALMRPGQPTRLLADPRRARERLGWTPRTSFEDLVRMMVEAVVLPGG
ncbi:MAG TPA: GDP-mannose 4,6-dehydratase [Anaeromyxobacteraceae bacterium]|nr:GDP-mannose 4,6-dehydratase [Anaeromyxobacteraceae bacterium]